MASFPPYKLMLPSFQMVTQVILFTLTIVLEGHPKLESMFVYVLFFIVESALDQTWAKCILVSDSNDFSARY